MADDISLSDYKGSLLLHVLLQLFPIRPRTARSFIIVIRTWSIGNRYTYIYVYMEEIERGQPSSLGLPPGALILILKSDAQINSIIKKKSTLNVA